MSILCYCNAGSRPNDVLITKNLTKLFSKHRAVNGLNFGVPAGQCFGLLGVNGAGKTTTFRMLTGIMSASGGDAYMMGHRLVHRNLLAYYVVRLKFNIRPVTV